jgi:hypothetical protein
MTIHIFNHFSKFYYFYIHKSYNVTKNSEDERESDKDDDDHKLHFALPLNFVKSQFMMNHSIFDLSLVAHPLRSSHFSLTTSLNCFIWIQGLTKMCDGLKIKSGYLKESPKVLGQKHSSRGVKNYSYIVSPLANISRYHLVELLLFR